MKCEMNGVMSLVKCDGIDRLIVYSLTSMKPSKEGLYQNAPVKMCDCKTLNIVRCSVNVHIVFWVVFGRENFMMDGYQYVDNA